MKSSTVFRLVLAVFAVGLALIGSGCGTSQGSGSAAIRPNWYDSYSYKSGKIVVPELPQNSPAAGVWGE